MNKQQADDLDIPSDADIVTGRYMTAIRQGQNQVEEGLMSHETYQEMEKACNREDGADCGDSMKKTLRDDLIAVDINAPQEQDLQQFTDPASLLSPEKFEKLKGQFVAVDSTYSQKQMSKFCDKEEENAGEVLLCAIEIIRQLQANQAEFVLTRADNEKEENTGH